MRPVSKTDARRINHLTGDTMAKPLALVTGASSGIGAAIALELAKRGHDLVLVARREDALRQLAQKLQTEHSICCHVMPHDLTAFGGVKAGRQPRRVGQQRGLGLDRQPRRQPLG
jgi:NAD(P)-dependent dehydrogenase (short-subunit alcohol dehydrogenase family)